MPAIERAAVRTLQTKPQAKMKTALHKELLKPMSKPIDLRSDTVTKPTPEMRQATFDAEVGDDVYHEDPTVNRLEQRSAEIIGKEAALFVPSGTMGNQVAIKAHTQPGDEIICDDRSHIVLYEMGGVAQLSGCVTRTIETPDGILHWEAVAKRVRRASDHFRGTGLISVENSHNVAGGRVYPSGVLEEICHNAHEAGIPVHMDGARVFNAAAYLGKPVHEVAAPVDSVTFCLSKGLGAPVGSVLTGTREFIDCARLVRKLLGGGMRQAGVLAAAGLVALEKSPADLPTDHANAHYLAQALAQISGIAIDPAEVETNILFFDCEGTGMAAADLSAAMRERGVLANGLGQTRMRLVTHHDVTRQECEQAIGVLHEIVTSKAA